MDKAVRGVVGIARDHTPSRVVELLSKIFPVTLFVGNGADITASQEAVLEAVRQADVLLLGMSHSPEAARMELLGGQAAGEQTKVVLYADSFFCSARDWFQPLRKRVDLVLTCTPSEAEFASTVFQSAIIASVGQPNWEANHFGAKEALARRKEIRENLGVRDTDKLIFVPFRKESDLNEAHLSAVIAANKVLADRPDNGMRFCVATHPGEPEAASRKRMYRGLVADHNQMAVVDTSTPEMLAACDLVINAGSGVGTEALYMGLPVIEFLPEIVLDELGRLQGGERIWQPCKDGAALSVTDDTGMACVIQELLDPHNPVSIAMRAKQKAHYPAPTKPGAAVEAMAASITALMDS